MDLERVASLLSGLNRPQIRANLCSRKRSPRSNCRKCEDFCPTGGIVISSDAIAVGECNGCGLCGAVCPNGVFEMPGANERYLLARAREAGRNSSNPVVYCLKGTSKSRERPDGVGVACLGQVTAEVMIAMAAEVGSLRFLYRSQDCAGCEVSRGGTVFEETLRVARRLLEAAMVGGGRLMTCETPGHLESVQRSPESPKKVNESRREFFALFLKGLRRVPAAVADEILGPPGQEQEVKPVWDRPSEFSGRRRGLAAALRRMRGGQLPEESQVPFPRLVISGPCYFCSACTRLCPTGALRLWEGEKGEKEIQADFSLCTACALCVDICPQRALEFQGNLTLGEVAAQEYISLDTGGERNCPACSETFTGNGLAEKCPRCTLFGRKIETENRR